MIFKAKLRRIGNSRGVILPSGVITGYILGEDVELEVITKKDDTSNKEQGVINLSKEERKPFKWCDKHEASTLTCKCK